MEIFGIGPLELLFIVLIALLVLGPKDMMKSAQKAAAWLKKLRQSEVWNSTKEVMDIPKQVLHESGLDKEIQELQNLSQKKIGDSVWQPNTLVPSGAVTKKAETAPEEQTISKPPSENSAAEEKPLEPEQPLQDDK
jgi:Sec-independent protein translocase protein TatA